MQLQYPYSGPDVLAFVLALLAVVYLALAWRDRERCMGAFALCMGTFALYAAAFDHHVPVDQYLPLYNPWTMLLALGLAAMSLGIVNYLPVPPRVNKVVLPALMVTCAGVFVIAAGVWLWGWPVPRVWFNLLLTLPVLVLSRLAGWCAPREPGAGHGVLALALFTVPGVAVFNAAIGSTATTLRFWGLFPIVVLGLTMLTVSLLRRRLGLEAEVERRKQAEAALTATNSTLETRVERRTRALSDMVDALDAFNRNVAHDLRGPVGSIAELSRLADESLQRGDAAMALRMLPAITQQAELSVSMMGALLSLARMSGEPLQRGPVALDALVQDVIAQLVLARPEAARVEVTATGLPVVQADAAMLRVAFVNLLGNAFKFSAGQDAPRVTVSADQVGQAGVVLHVQDNGPGFDAEAATNLFSPFVRLHGTLCEGHGLGLTIVRRVVERHGGRVWAESQPGQGARFSFTLPGAP